MFWTVWRFWITKWSFCREPNVSRIHVKGSDKGFVGNKDSFILLTLVATSEGVKNVDTS